MEPYQNEQNVPNGRRIEEDGTRKDDYEDGIHLVYTVRSGEPYRIEFVTSHWNSKLIRDFGK